MTSDPAAIANELDQLLQQVQQVIAATHGPVPSGASGQVSDLVNQARGSLANLQHAAQLEKLLPLLVLAVAVLVNKVAVGVVLAVVIYLAGQPKGA